VRKIRASHEIVAARKAIGEDLVGAPLPKADASGAVEFELRAALVRNPKPSNGNFRRAHGDLVSTATRRRQVSFLDDRLRPVFICHMPLEVDFGVAPLPMPTHSCRLGGRKRSLGVLKRLRPNSGGL
jgi:hypothetical protein